MKGKVRINFSWRGKIFMNAMNIWNCRTDLTGKKRTKGRNRQKLACRLAVYNM